MIDPQKLIVLCDGATELEGEIFNPSSIKAIVQELIEARETITTLNKKVEETNKIADRLARTMDNFDNHPLAKEALKEFREKLKQLESL